MGRSISGHRQALVFALGGAGVGMGDALWQLLANEHGLYPNGSLNEQEEHHNLANMFYESHLGTYHPRALFIDLDPNSINQMMMHVYGAKLYDHSGYLVGHKSAGGNFARGKSLCEGEFHLKLRNSCRRMLENCDLAHSAIITRASIGGCGSGVLSCLLNAIEPMVSKNVFEIIPSNSNDTVLGPYNFILGQQDALEYTDMFVCMHNDMMRRITKKFLPHVQPSHYVMNQLVAMIISSFCQDRFQGNPENSRSFRCLNNSLAPLRTLKHAFPGVGSTFQEIMTGHISAYDLIKTADAIRLLEIPKTSIPLTAALAFRGYITRSEIAKGVGRWKNESFVLPSAISQSSINVAIKAPENFCIKGSPLSVVKLENNAAFQYVLLDELEKYCGLLESNSYVHWYLKYGMEYEDFKSAFEFSKVMCDDYGDICRTLCDSINFDGNIDEILLQSSVASDDFEINPGCTQYFHDMPMTQNMSITNSFKQTKKKAKSKSNIRPKNMKKVKISDGKSVLFYQK